MEKDEGNGLRKAKVVQEWAKTIAMILALVVTVGGMISGIVWGKYEKHQNADLLKRLDEAKHKQDASDAKQATAGDTIQSLQNQILELKEQTLTCKSAGTVSEQWQKTYETCAKKVEAYKQVDAIKSYIDDLTSQSFEIQNEIYHARESLLVGAPLSPDDAQTIASLQKRHDTLEMRIMDAQKRLICPQ